MTRFRHLSDEKDVRFGANSMDVRGWPVRLSGDNSQVGEVHDLIVDDTHRTRYVDIGLDDGRHVLMPSGDVRVNGNARTLELPLSDRNRLNDVPEYNHRPESVTPEYAASLARVYDDAYDDRHFHERADYTSRWGGRGEAARGTVAEVDRLDDIEVADGNPDPRGWNVVGRDGEKVGEVQHLIGDTGAMKVRYLTVKLDKSIASDRHEILVPVGHVDLDPDNDRVIARALDASGARECPTYKGGALRREDEHDVTRRFSERYSGERHFEHPRYRDPFFWAPFITYGAYVSY